MTSSSTYGDSKHDRYRIKSRIEDGDAPARVYRARTHALRQRTHARSEVIDDHVVQIVIYRPTPVAGGLRASDVRMAASRFAASRDGRGDGRRPRKRWAVVDISRDSESRFRRQPVGVEAMRFQKSSCGLVDAPELVTGRWAVHRSTWHDVFGRIHGTAGSARAWMSLR